MKRWAVPVLSLTFLFSTLAANAATKSWSGATSGTWSTASNWVGAVAPVAGDDLNFANTANANALNNDYVAGTAFHSLTFNAAGTFSPAGNAIALGTGGLTQTSGTTLNNFIPLTLSASQTWNVASPGNIGMNGPATLALGANTLTITGSGSHYFGNTITGTGGITLGGSVTLTITGSPNHTGPTTVGGTAHLVLSTPNAIATPIIVNNGAYLDDAIGYSGFMNGPLTINAGGTYDVVINGAALLQYSKVTVNSGVITLAGNLAVTNTVVSPVGTVFTIIANQTGSAISGTFAGLPEGATFTAGGQVFKISYAHDVTLTVQGAALTATTTTLSSSLNPSTSGQSVTFTATVSPTATGTVTFYDGPTVLGTGTLNGSSQATYSTSALALGTHNITATYGGDGTHSSSSSTLLVQTVNGIATTTTLASSLNPSTAGQSVTFTATISPTAAGTVTFYDGASLLGSGSVNGSSQATYTTSALTAGSHSITAAYGGDINHATSTSAVLTQVVNAGATATTTTLTSSANPATVGQSVTFTATVAPNATGTVAFYDGPTQIGSGALNGSSQATFTSSSLAAGTHSITATYSGDGTHAGSSSAALSQVINALTATTTTVSSSVNPSTSGQSVTFTATVSPAVTGGVDFYDGATFIGTATLSGSQATLSTSSLTAGTHSITAAYNGDATHASSVSAPLSQVVNSVAPAAVPALDGRALVALTFVLAALAALKLKA